MRIAHLSDMHLLEPAERRGFDVRFVSLGRRLDAAGRHDKAHTAITAATNEGAEHYIFTGDLTETGTSAQFEALAALLAECNLPPDAVTLLPGNHDAYTSPHGWRDALDGPLRAYARNAAREPGKVVELADVFVLPVDATFHQPVTRSAGRLSPEIEAALASRLADDALARKPVVVAIHHPPHPRPGPWHWVDGLLGGKRLLGMLERHDAALIVHGHLHKAIERVHGAARIVGAAAVVDGASPMMFGERTRNTIELVA